MAIKNRRTILFYSILVIILFLIDRFSKLYILILAETESGVDIYVTSFLNFYLTWNTGIGFGLFSFDKSIIYKLITYLILTLNIVIIIMIYRTNDYRVYFLLLVLGGSSGNLFDRLYYFAVPDFIDLHIGSYHWFVFNVADIFITIGIIGLISVELLKKEKLSKNA